MIAEIYYHFKVQHSTTFRVLQSAIKRGVSLSPVLSHSVLSYWVPTETSNSLTFPGQTFINYQVSSGMENYPTGKFINSLLQHIITRIYHFVAIKNA